MESSVNFIPRTTLILMAILTVQVPGALAQNPEGPTTPAITQQEAAARPLQHLTQAERLLNDTDVKSLKKKEAKESVAKLRDHFMQLESAYRASRSAFVPPAVIEDTNLKPDASSSSQNWKMSFTKVENDLARILGGGSALPPSTPTGAETISTPGTEPSTAGTAPVGTSGTAAAPPATTPAIPDGTQSGQTTTAATPVTPSNVPGTTVAGSESTQAAAGTPAGAIGTPANTVVTPAGGLSTGSVVADIGIKDLDPVVRHQLEQLRLEVELFFAAATMDFENQTAPQSLVPGTAATATEN
jgi:hypothetical protein